MFTKLIWQDNGINADEVRLRFDDDIMLIGNTGQELRRMIRGQRTKTMSNENIEVTVSGHRLENVPEYIYLEHKIKLGK